MNYFSYFSEIEETFIRRRGKNLFLSPLDWALIETWQEREVPLHIILRGIEKVFDSYDANPKRNRTIKSLMYCREEIEAQYNEWLESQVGKNGTVETEQTAESSEFSDQAIHDYLENVSAELKAAELNAASAIKETLERVRHRLNELKNNFTNAEKLEEDLTHVEKILDESLLADFDKEKLTKLQTETATELQTYKKTMEKEAYQQTFDLLLLKKLRLEAKIPRLSLFYL